MDKLQFIKWEETPELNFLGVAHVLYDNCFVLKFKIVENKDGTGFFVASPSFKREINGEDKWEQWFFMDSRSKGDAILDFIRNNVQNEMKRTNMNNNQTVQQTKVIIQTEPTIYNDSGTSTNENKQPLNNQKQENWVPDECPF